MADVSSLREIIVGVDVAERRKGLDLVALRSDRVVVASAGGLTVDELAKQVLGHVRPAAVCIDSPSAWAVAGRSRAAERELRALGISAFATPTDPGDHAFYRWMRVGFSIYEALAPSYSLYRHGDVRGTAVEVFPAATATVLAGRNRDRAETKEGFRRQVLERHGLGGDLLPTLDRVDAALGALTGLLALEAQANVVGDPSEGVILLPSNPNVRSSTGTARRAEHLVKSRGKQTAL